MAKRDHLRKVIDSVKPPREKAPRDVKELNKESKIISGDIDFIHERIELLKNLCSLESHSWSAFVKTVVDDLIKSGTEISQITPQVVEKAISEKWGDREELRRFNMFRMMRRDYLKPLAAKGHEKWCRGKHILEAMMRVHENAARYVMQGEEGLATQCALDYAKLYYEFLDMNNLN